MPIVFRRVKNNVGRHKIIDVLRVNELIDVNCSQFTLKRIAQGAINHNYQVQNKQSCILLKVLAQSNKLPINRVHVFKLQEELAILGLAPKPIFLSEDQLFYCEEWIDFEAIPLEDAIQSLSEALYSIHNCFIPAPIIPLIQHWQIYWQKIIQPTPELTDKYHKMCQQWYAYLNTHKDRFVLCHNDLHVSHMCSPNGPILDWEYAGLGCQYFDIASCCIINKLNCSQKIALCQHYAELANKSAQEVIERTENITEIVEFTYNIWNYSLGLTNSLQ